MMHNNLLEDISSLFWIEKNIIADTKKTIKANYLGVDINLMMSFIVVTVFVAMVVLTEEHVFCTDCRNKGNGSQPKATE